MIPKFFGKHEKISQKILAIFKFLRGHYYSLIGSILDFLFYNTIFSGEPAPVLEQGPHLRTYPLEDRLVPRQQHRGVRVPAAFRPDDETLPQRPSSAQQLRVYQRNRQGVSNFEVDFFYRKKQKLSRNLLKCAKHIFLIVAFFV